MLKREGNTRARPAILGEWAYQFGTTSLWFLSGGCVCVNSGASEARGKQGGARVRKSGRSSLASMLELLEKRDQGIRGGTSGTYLKKRNDSLRPAVSSAS